MTLSSSSHHHHHHHHSHHSNNPNSISRRYHLITDQSSKNDDGKFILINSQELKLYQSWRSSLNHQKSNHYSHQTNQSYLHHRLIYSLNNLPQAKCYDWHTTPNHQSDLLAAGTFNGRAYIIKLPKLNQTFNKSNKSTSNSNLNQSPLIGHSSLPSSSNLRPCTSIAFSPSGRLIALGLEKGRDYGLQILDIEGLSDHSSSTAIETHLQKPPIAHAVSSETINALGFLSVTPASHQSMLLVASSTKSIRLYDLRSPGLNSNNERGPRSSLSTSHPIVSQVLNPNGQWVTRSVIGFKSDPFDPHRFASWGDDGCVRIWDTRKTTESLLLLSEDSVNHETRSTSARSSKNPPISLGSSSIQSLTWSKSRKGVLVTLSADPQRVRVWDLVEGSTQSTALRNRSDGMTSLKSWDNVPTSLTNTSTYRNSSQSSPVASSQESPRIPAYSVFSTRLLKPLKRTSQTIASVRIPTITSSERTSSPHSVFEDFSETYLGVSRDGHLEFLESRRSGEAVFGAKRNMVFSDGMRLRISPRPSNQDDNVSRENVPDLRLSIPSQVASPENQASFIPSPAFSQSISTGLSDVGLLTPRPLGSEGYPYNQGSLQSHPNRLASDLAELQLANKFGRHLTVNSTWENSIGFDEKKDEHLLQNDISGIMMKRARVGYGTNLLRNQQLTSSSSGLSAFWEWVAHSEKLFQQGNGLVNGYDFSFRGVLSIMRGFATGGGLRSDIANSQTSKHGISSTSDTFAYSDPSLHTSHNRRSTSRNPDQQKELSQYVKSVRQFNHTNQINNFTISSEFSDQRQTALFLCGPDYNSKDVDQIASKYEALGMYGKASAIAFFSGNTQRAITSLQRSNDTQLQLLAPPLATHLNTQRSGHPRDPLFDQVCRQLANDGTTEPYIRAIFSYCSTGDWHEVIDETGLPLKDRIAVALRFLADEEIFHWLDGVARDMVSSGCLEGILLTGLQPSNTLSINGEAQVSDGFKLLQNYINRTGDIQSVALSIYLLVPDRLHSYGMERCIESYRRLLDRWENYTVRIKFDIARGKKAREISSCQKSSVLPSLVPLAPPQLIIWCQHCSEVLSDGPNVTTHLKSISSMPDVGITNTNTHASNLASMASFKNVGPTTVVYRTNRCPGCGKSLRKCAICLMSNSNKTYTSDQYCWCHRCRHLSHADHLQEWKDRGNEVCPVTGCECNCWEDK